MIFYDLIRYFVQKEYTHVILSLCCFFTDISCYHVYFDNILWQRLFYQPPHLVQIAMSIHVPYGWYISSIYDIDKRVWTLCNLFVLLHCFSCISFILNHSWFKRILSFFTNTNINSWCIFNTNKNKHYLAMTCTSYQKYLYSLIIESFR